MARIVYERTRLWLELGDSMAEIEGLDSMAAVELTVRIQEEFNLPIGWTVDLAGVTLGEVAEGIDALLARQPPAEPAPDAAAVLRPEGEGQPVFLAAPLFHGRAAVARLASGIPEGSPVYGLVNDGAHTTALSLAHAYAAQVRAVQPSGPWHLAGYSYGGAVVHLAARLRAEAVPSASITMFPLDPQLSAGSSVEPAAMEALFVEAARSNGRADAEPGTEALYWYRRLVDPGAGPADLADYLAARSSELASLGDSDVAQLARRPLDCDVVYFRASGAAPGGPTDLLTRSYRHTEVIDLPQGHFRLLDAAEQIGRVLDARIAAARRAPDLQVDPVEGAGPP